MTTLTTDNILTLIETDHDKVDMLFQEIQKANGSNETEQLFEQIYQELSLHSEAEEQTLYSKMQNYPETQKYVEEAKTEHHEAKSLLEQMKKIEVAEADFQTKLQELIEAIKHHVTEEEGEIFQAIRKVMDEEQLQELGIEFQNAKAELLPKVAVAAQ
jgi:hemerythrin superfamily protein